MIRVSLRHRALSVDRELSPFDFRHSLVEKVRIKDEAEGPPSSDSLSRLKSSSCFISSVLPGAFVFIGLRSDESMGSGKERLPVAEFCEVFPFIKFPRVAG